MIRVRQELCDGDERERGDGRGGGGGANDLEEGVEHRGGIEGSNVFASLQIIS